MKYEEMTFQQKRRFKGCKCPMCGGAINRYQDVQVVQVRDGRYVHNFYIHSSCLLKSLRKNEDETIYADTDSIKISLQLPSQLGTSSEEEGLYEAQEV